ncbi:class I SAM-dependent methyltransferase [Clostridium sp. C2-6-12]|uniref:class I SAM-dependent methyltransferase n=1 Tax=Clostridium sp. C2-6-12 TaxID=2698832 RepID=UPI001FAE1B49|nr:class I SAM-dependent methyltransferase [Clostridium sp. C2-6-12]
MEEKNNVKMNLKYYSGEDYYSDGDIEKELVEITRNNDDFSQIIKDDCRWPILYHLSPIRRNLLEWMEFENDSSVLEIGAGCGALTGVFCEKAKDVIAVELSKVRAEVISNRYKNHNNLEIIVGNLNDIDFGEKKFDYITLIGVLEYAGGYSNYSDPYCGFLEHVTKLLKPEGKLIVAIENRFGLKYWAGAREDHTGNLFHSIKGYDQNSNVKTFSKNELIELFSRVGLTSLDFYYPIPDYKLPMQIFSDEFMPRVGDVTHYFPNYDTDRLQLFDEKSVYEDIIKNNKFDFFANSFLVICKKGEVI